MAGITDSQLQQLINAFKEALGSGGGGSSNELNIVPKNTSNQTQLTEDEAKAFNNAIGLYTSAFSKLENALKRASGPSDVTKAYEELETELNDLRQNIQDTSKEFSQLLSQDTVNEFSNAIDDIVNKRKELEENFKDKKLDESLSKLASNYVTKTRNFGKGIKSFGDGLQDVGKWTGRGGGAISKMGGAVSSVGKTVMGVTGKIAPYIAAIEMADKAFASCAEKVMQYQKLRHDQYINKLGASTTAQVNSIKVSVTALSNAVQASSEAITANIETNLVQAKAIADNRYAQMELNHQWTNWIPIMKTCNKLAEARMKIQNEAAQAEISNAQKIAEMWISSTNAINEAMKTMDESQRAYQRLTGLPSSQMAEFREGLYKAGEAVADFGKTTDDILKARTAFINESGRNIAWSQADTTKALSMGSLIGDDTMNNFAAGMVLFNTSVSDSADIMLNVYKDANKMGISSQKLTKSVLSNLKQANKYNFKEGVEGFIKAAKWAETARYDMASLGATLDKVQEGGLEGVLQQSAQLQVLGGNAATGADPMKMMYAAFNDPEAYAKMQQNALKNFGHINAKTGESQFNMADQMQIATIAKAYGLSKDQAMEMARASNKRSAIEMANGSLSGDALDAIANRAQYNKNTKQWEVTMANGTTKNVSQLTSNDIDNIAPEDLRTSEEIAKDTLSATEKIASEAAKANVLLAKMGGFEEYLRHVDETTKITREGNEANAKAMLEGQTQVNKKGEEDLIKQFERFGTASPFVQATDEINENVNILAMSKKERRREKREERRDIRDEFKRQLANSNDDSAVRKGKRLFKRDWRGKGKLGVSKEDLANIDFAQIAREHVDDGLILHGSGKVVSFNDNDNIMAAKDGGFFSKAMKVSKVIGGGAIGGENISRQDLRIAKQEWRDNYRDNSEISMKPVEINLNGTLNLTGGGQSVNIIDIFKNNQEFLKQLSQMISTEMGKALNGGKSVAWNGRFGK